MFRRLGGPEAQVKRTGIALLIHGLQKGRARAIVFLFLLSTLASCGQKSVHVWGTIPEGANAKVIVSVWSHGFWDQDHHALGVIADAHGRWEVLASAPFRVNSLYASVCTQDGRYGFAEIQNGPVEFTFERDFKKVFGYQADPPGAFTYDWMTYESFSGPWGGVTWSDGAE